MSWGIGDVVYLVEGLINIDKVLGGVFVKWEYGLEYREMYFFGYGMIFGIMDL